MTESQFKDLLTEHMLPLLSGTKLGGRQSSSPKHALVAYKNPCSLVMKPAVDAGYLFPGRSPKAPLSNMAFLMLLRRMGRTDITTHGFRSSLRDWCAEKTSTPQAVVEAALAHVLKNRAEAAYFRSDLFDLRRQLMESWAQFATAKPSKAVSLGA